MASNEVLFGRQLSRYCDLLSELSGPTAFSSKELAQRHETSQRTIQRDLKVLEDAFGIPVISEARPDGTKSHRLDQGASVSRQTVRSSLVLHGLSHTEAMLLSLGLGHLPIGKSAPWYAVLEALKYKLQLLVRGDSPGAGHDARNPETWLLQDNRSAKVTTPAPEVFNHLLQALGRGNACRVRYRAAGKAQDKEYVIDPACLFDYQGGLYVFARARGKDIVLPYALERLSAVRVLGESAQLPADFDPHDYLLRSFNLVVNEPLNGIRIRVDSHQAPYIRERIWGANQTIEEHSDGSVTLGFDTLGASEVVRWILSQGEHAVVVEPSTLVESVREKIRVMSHLYT